MSKTHLATKTFKAGQHIFKEGQKGREAYLIQHGYVSAWRTEGGRRISLGTRSEGEIVGEMALIDDSVRSATVTAGSDVEVKVITRKAMESALSEAPEILATILRQLLESLRTANDLVAMYAAKLEELTSDKKP
jgi:CRP-like cAMP-binding protein